MSVGATEKSRFSQEMFAAKTSESADSVTYPAVVSTINANRSPLLSEVVPVVIYGLRLTVNFASAIDDSKQSHANRGMCYQFARP
jgi:hypothetical protein